MTQLIYLACPYSGTNYERHLRFLEANKTAGILIEQGFHVFSPISHSHPIKEICGLDGDFTFWESYDKRMISLCDLVVVLPIVGWIDSVGVQSEINFAHSIGKSVKFIDLKNYQIIEEKYDWSKFYK